MILPTFFPATFDAWRASFETDADGEGRTLFRELTCKAAYDEGEQVGGCEIHFVDAQTAYLRWIYVNGNITGRGIGSKCINALKRWLYEKGIRRFDTDTALTNTVAQHFYDKNGFTREAVTRSFYRDMQKER